MRTPVVYDATKENKVDEEAVYDNPKEVFPNSYVEYTETLYGQEDDLTKSMTSFIVNLIFLAPSGAQGVTLCVCRCVRHKKNIISFYERD